MSCSGKNLDTWGARNRTGNHPVTRQPALLQSKPTHNIDTCYAMQAITSSERSNMLNYTPCLLQWFSTSIYIVVVLMGLLKATICEICIWKACSEMWMLTAWLHPPLPVIPKAHPSNFLKGPSTHMSVCSRGKRHVFRRTTHNTLSSPSGLDCLRDRF